MAVFASDAEKFNCVTFCKDAELPEYTASYAVLDTLRFALVDRASSKSEKVSNPKLGKLAVRLRKHFGAQAVVLVRGGLVGAAGVYEATHAACNTLQRQLWELRLRTPTLA